MIWNDNLNEYNAQFIATMIMRNSNKYSYGRQELIQGIKDYDAKHEDSAASEEEKESC